MHLKLAEVFSASIGAGKEIAHGCLRRGAREVQEILSSQVCPQDYPSPPFPTGVPDGGETKLSKVTYKLLRGTRPRTLGPILPAMLLCRNAKSPPGWLKRATHPAAHLIGTSRVITSKAQPVGTSLGTSPTPEPEMVAHSLDQHYFRPWGHLF